MSAGQTVRETLDEFWSEMARLSRLMSNAGVS